MTYYSFIMICHGQWKYTEQAIHTLNQSLSSSLKEKGIEVIVVNNASEDETKAGLEQIKELLKSDIEVVPVHLSENMGWTGGTNVGFSKARGNIITILNNDLLFPENWFDGIARTLDENPSIGAAGPFIANAGGPAGVSVQFQTYPEVNNYGKQYMQDHKDKLLFVEGTVGGCISMRRELFSLIGGNDYWFGIGWGEDIDLSFRIGVSGYKIAIVGASFVYHCGGATIGHVGKYVTAALKANDYKLVNKWNLASGLDRKTIIETTAFSKDKHSFPCRLEDFNPPAPRNNSTSTKLLLVADWSNECSQWRSKLEKVMQRALSDNLSLTLWIPRTYYPLEQIKPEVDKHLGEKQTFVHYYFDDVPGVDLLKYFNDFDVFLTVEEDFVNQYFKYLIVNSLVDMKVE